MRFKTDHSIRRITLRLSVWVLFVCCPVLSAETLRVPEDYETIQDAIDAAVDGDEVVVSPGTFFEAIDFLGKALHVRSTEGSDVTIIDATGLNTSAATCATGEGRDSLLEGFTMTGGAGTEGPGERLSGGGMYIDHSSPTIRNCTFRDLSVPGFGSGLVARESKPLIVGCRFIGNSIMNGNSGGAIGCMEGSVCFVESCMFADNVGSAIWNSTSELHVIDCAFVGNQGRLGGGIGGAQGSIQVVGSDFVANTGHWAGAIAFQSGAMAVQGCRFEGNSADADHSTSGAVRAYTSTAEFEDCIFEGNTASQAGAVLTVADTVVESCTFVSNSATGGAGGALLAVARLSTVIFRNTEFRQNHARTEGGGAWVSGGHVRFENCVLDQNTARHGGGGVWASAGDIGLAGCQFTENTAESGGGAFLDGGEATIINSQFTRNQASFFGGAIAAEGDSLLLANSLLDRNSAESVGGLDAYVDRLALANCTFADNTSEDRCGAAAMGRGVSMSVTGSVIWGNVPVGICTFSDMTEVIYSNVEGGYEGDGNIDADPLFVGTDPADYRLATGSPCIDAADNQTIPPDLFDLDGNGDTEEPIPFDLAGLPRFVDDPETDDTGRCDDPCERPIVDMGAYEFQAGAGGCQRDPEWLCDGDVDGDGQVNPVDSGLVQAAFGSVDEQDVCNYDLDCDGQINAVDRGIVESLFGTCEAPRPACP